MASRRAIPEVILADVLTVVGSLGGLLLGPLVTSFGLIHLTPSEVQVADGNEWTPVVTGAGALTGAVVGMTSFFRRHVFSFLLMGLGLVAAVVLRDEYLLQPPIVFVDLSASR